MIFFIGFIIGIIISLLLWKFKKIIVKDVQINFKNYDKFTFKDQNNVIYKYKVLII
jgi:hypothetical protein